MNKTPANTWQSVRELSPMNAMQQQRKANEQTSSHDWQTIRNKRALSPLEGNNNKQTKMSGNDANTSSNRFSILADQLTMQSGEESEYSIPKPPPIYVPNVQNIAKMALELMSVIPEDEFSYKCMKNNDIRIMISTIESYRTLVKHFDSTKTSYHTFQLKQERSYRVAIKGIHHSLPVENIKSALSALGHQVRNVVNVKSKHTKQPLSMFFVDLEPSPENNKKIYDIKTIENAIVKIEPIKKAREMVQCHRCQEFGHTKTYCKKTYRCVKCALQRMP